MLCSLGRRDVPGWQADGKYNFVVHTVADSLLTPADVRELDRRAIEEFRIPGYTLMCRAGQAAFDVARARFPAARRWAVVCGGGNNGGDGYVIARLARAAGLDAQVYAASDPDQLRGDAARAWSEYVAAGGVAEPARGAKFAGAGLIVDALLGTGLDRPVDGAYRDIVEAINSADAPVMAVDIPSGLNGSSGAIMAVAVRAALTVTFVGRKQGLYMNAGPEACGEVVFDDLDVPAEVMAGVEPTLRLFNQREFATLLPARPADAHKGRFGHVLIVGGNHGMGGAVRLAGEAALRAGAGLVSIATRAATVPAVVAGRPELMCAPVGGAADLDALLARATVVAIGPGLGQDEWAVALFEHALSQHQPLVLDADALNLLAGQPQRRDSWVLTPHPGEAGRLLGISTAAVQADRVAALRLLTERYGGVSLLKGRGTLVGLGDEIPWLIDRGNPGMATAGMGDVLTGTVAGILAQAPGAGLNAAAAAAWVHALAGDRAAVAGERGLLAGDVLDELRTCLNPST
jgi:hydroxyethylthiazole kinase-like uncharacterized protein yjeF